MGWVHARRDHGKLIFIDLRDRSGILQTVAIGNANPEVFDIVSTLRAEYVVALTGEIKARGEKQINTDTATGGVEMKINHIEILNESETPVFEIEKAPETGEELRMQYRYLDLRSDRMRNNIQKRHEIVSLVRSSLIDQKFWEIETPYLTKGTPEGAREFVVPARLQPGEHFVLPQSPQQFKQLLMVGGVEKYFQIARCFRDEDARGDRQAEFTQVDMELSFVDSEDIMQLNEKLLIDIVTRLYPEKRIQTLPFPHITYKDAMNQYGNDRPDLRKDKDDPNLLSFCWVVEFPMFEKVDHKAQPNNPAEWTFTHNPFSAPLPAQMELLRAKENVGDIISTQYDIVLNGYEIGGGSVRTHRPDDLRKTLEIIGHSDKAIERDFGHMLKAFTYGAPPHAGIAWGLERLVMLLQDEKSIRDVMAFPKTGDSKDILMGAPSKLL
ncbi:MAG: aspartyl-tRNA synthetase, aspartyl-tRNA synthetase [Candidatus Saccharibacteria bacterium]|nr:aspartyl-tRNA synthetase, aspartyl-tRNA synthetase [Candidatus Saccharibacteria bacterium]